MEDYVIDAEFAAKLATMPVRILDTIYSADINARLFFTGDMVLDRLDGAHAQIMEIRDDQCVIGDCGVFEIGVPLNRLIRLIPRPV